MITTPSRSINTPAGRSRKMRKICPCRHLCDRWEVFRKFAPSGIFSGTDLGKLIDITGSHAILSIGRGTGVYYIALM
jgi:hypothetical protein